MVHFIVLYVDSSLTAFRVVVCLACKCCCYDHCTPVQAQGAAGSSACRREAALGSVRLEVSKGHFHGTVCRYSKQWVGSQQL